AIITLGTILEATLSIPDAGIFNSNAGVALRLDRACERNWINSEQRDRLKELWVNRNNVHLRLLDTHEFNKYRVEHVNVPHAALLSLMAALKTWFEAEQATPPSPPASARS